MTAVTLAMKSKEKSAVSLTAPKDALQADANVKIPFSRKLKWLTNLLWGGSFLLAYEHLWHGEIVPWFPFLTAAADPSDAAVMLHEMATIGVSMAILVTAVWVVMLLVSGAAVRKARKAEARAD